MQAKQGPFKIQKNLQYGYCVKKNRTISKFLVLGIEE